LLGATAVSAVSSPVELIQRVTHLNHPSADLGLVESRLIFPPGARWDVDPEAGPLTLTVEHGTVGVVLGDGLARIERHVSPLQEARIHRLDPNQMAFLWPGDRLVVVDGYRLRVDNDDAAIAAAMASRIVQAPLPAMPSTESVGQPR
jgi:hypothetical protein